MRSSSLGLASVVAACLISVSAQARGAGITGYSGKQQGATCMSGCHGNAPSPTAPTVELSGPTSLAPGATGDYALIIRGGPAQEGGLNVAVSDNGGTLATVGADTKILNGELTHTSPKAFLASGEVRFDFRLTAPATEGTVTLYGAGNSVNNNNSNTGDHAVARTLQIQVANATPPPTVEPDKDEDKGCAAAGGPPMALALLLLARALRRRD